jgi:hypothetical protein
VWQPCNERTGSVLVDEHLEGVLEGLLETAGGAEEDMWENRESGRAAASYKS